MQKNPDFGGEISIGMYILFSVQVEVVPPLFLSRRLSRSTNGDARKLGEEGADLPRSSRSTPSTMRRAGELRKVPTLAEAKLWSCLKGNRLNGISFRRQHAIGKYIVDFCPPKAKLIIELDGSQHLKQKEYDLERIKYLSSQGYRVLRFWNNDVIKDIESVIRTIIFAIESQTRCLQES